MSIHRYFVPQFTSRDWSSMQRAHQLASHELGRHWKTHEHSNRLARTIMNFYQRGVHDLGLLATLSANRERSVINQGASAQVITCLTPFGLDTRAPHPEGQESWL